ncbi:MAG TPA: hypothetical protein ENH70_03040 [Desulfobacteraceae bacterium]|nr:MAG: hypothetical protein DRG82_03985 [Deltaproteobacteria bacterium]HDZ23497.1 hypothetical protein [Desulfobacteraceae bacterium]
MTIPSGVIEVDLFPENVNSASHPDAVRFKKTLDSVVEEYRCNLITFEVREGTVSFSFDSEALMADILKILQTPPDPMDSGE